MKTQYIAAMGIVGLLIVFAVGSSVYTSQREAEVEEVSRAADSPLEREYSVSLGPAGARVVLVEFFDPACETCRVFASHVKTLLASHPGKVRLVLRYAPLHPGSDSMVLILEAARKQGKFWETLDVMYETQPKWASHHHPQPDLIWQFLPSAGVDVKRIRRDMNDPDLRGILHQDIADGKTLGVRKTPQFYVNGKPLTRFGYRQLKALLDAEVAAQY